MILGKYFSTRKSLLVVFFSQKDKRIVKNETSTSKSKSSVKAEIRTPGTTKSGKLGTSSPFTSKVKSAKTTPAKVQQKLKTPHLQTPLNKSEFTPHAVRAKSFIGTPQSGSATAKSAQKRKISKVQSNFYLNDIWYICKSELSLISSTVALLVKVNLLKVDWHFHGRNPRLKLWALYKS